MNFIPSTGIAGAEFNIYTEGLCCASVCSSLPQDEVERRMAAHWNGIDSKWTLSDEPTFSNGVPNPCPCEQLPETHTHYLFVC